MTSRLTEVVVDCHDPSALAAFWTAALDYHVVSTEGGQFEIAARSADPADPADPAEPAEPTDPDDLVARGRRAHTGPP